MKIPHRSIKVVFILLGMVILLGQVTVYGQHLSTQIRLNQIGFYSNGPKIAVIAKDADSKFFITSPDLSQTFYTGELSLAHQSSYSTGITRIADFSDFTREGTYVLSVPGLGFSYQFEIKPKVFNGLAIGALKSFYFQRMSIPLAYEYAGKWSRPSGHPDDKVLVHASAATPQRPEGTVISSSRGWYDAGDYNKYIVNSGITVGTMLSLYEDFPGYCNSVADNIPESRNKVPDLLDEILWNLRWMLTMQDPSDGGVYHKLTNPSFDAFIAPADAQAPRYVVQKSTAAALDFAAVMAQAARVFKKFTSELPGLADSCLKASEYAWTWAEKNPKVVYNQRALDAKYDPDISTGEYGDWNFQDEFIWAASELFISTKNEKYYKAVNLFPDHRLEVPSWGNVRLLGYYSLLRWEKQLPATSAGDLAQLKSDIRNLADSILSGNDKNAYMAPICNSARNFVWGSNAVAANQAIELLQVYKLTNNKKYLSGAVYQLDYLLGRNATAYSYVTGFGSKPSMNPHHRPSASDEILEPIPGLLVGGPNPGKQDGVVYASSIADEAYSDVTASYASNEIAINWNAPLVYLVWALEALNP